MELKVVCFSDTHTTHDKIVVPECDLLLFGGDYSNWGDQEDGMWFMDWFNSQTQATEKVFINGNHEVRIDPNKRLGLHPQWFINALERYDNIHYLEHSSIELFGLKIFGSPYTPDFFPEYWGYNVPRGEKIKAKWAEIPDDTNILISHGPMKGYRDFVKGSGLELESKYPTGNVGCYDLFERVQKLEKLKLMLVGHIHNNMGVDDVVMGDRTFKYVNGAMVNDRNHLKHQPLVITLEV